MKPRRRPRGSGALSASFAVVMVLAAGAAAASSGGMARVVDGARDAVFGHPANDSTASGIDHAATVVADNEARNPQAPGLSNALDHLSGAGAAGGHPQPGGGSGRQPSTGHQHGHAGTNQGHGHGSHQNHAGGGGAGTHAAGAVGQGAGMPSDRGHTD